MTCLQVEVLGTTDARGYGLSLNIKKNKKWRKFCPMNDTKGIELVNVNIQIWWLVNTHLD